jgi:hypothetical protein
MLAEKQAYGLHHHDGRDLSAELEGICSHMDGIMGKCTTEAEQLS